MALVPLKQTVIVTKAAGSNGWGRPSAGGTVTYKVRAVEETRIVKNQAGKEALTTARIIFDKLPDLSYDDAITYTNELGVTIERSPMKIEVKRGLNGKPLITEVFV
jgi:hypothetical protein